MFSFAQRASRAPQSFASQGSRRQGWQRYRALLGLLLLAAAVLGYWAVSERQRDRQRSESARHPALQLIADSSLPEPRRRTLDEVTIELAGPGATRTTFALQRRRSGQKASFYLDPPGRRAADAEVEALLSALLAAVAERSLQPSGAADDTYRAYGVGDEQCRARVRFGSGHTLCFGSDSPGGAVYVRADHAPAILVVERTLFELLSRPPAHYRSRRLILTSLGSAQHIALGPLHLFHDGDLWRVQLDEGGWALAEPALVEELVQRLVAWSVSSWPAAPPAGRDAPPAGCDAPPAGRDAPPTGRDAPPLRLLVDGAELLRGGWPCPGDPGDQLFLRDDGEAVCAAAPVGPKQLPRGTELRAQRLVPGATVVRLQGPSDVDVVRQPDGTYAQRDQPVDTASVRRTLELLTQRRALTAAARVQASPAGVRIVITTLLGQRITLQLWHSGTRTLVQRDAEPVQLLNEDDAAEELFDLTPLRLAPLQLLALEPATVQRISRHGSSEEVLERSAGWHLREPTRAPADSAAVATLLAVLSDLRAARWVGLRTRPEYGLTPPRLRLAMTLGRSGSQQESAPAAGTAAAPEPGLEVGGPAGDHGDCYARQRGDAAVAVLPAATCATLAQPLLSKLLVRLDEDRLTALQVAPGPDGTAALSCTPHEGRWQCGRRPLATAALHALFTALHALEHGARPTYGPPPTAPPRMTLQLTHAPLGRAMLRPTVLGAAADLGEEVAPLDQTLRLYAAADGSFLARIDQRDVTYRLPGSAFAALQAALFPAAP